MLVFFWNRSDVRGYGEGWLYRDNKCRHFISGHRYDETETWAYSSVDLYPFLEVVW